MLALAGFGVALLYLVIAYFGQRPMLYPAAWVPTPVGRGPAEPVQLNGPTGSHRALLLLPDSAASVRFPLLFFAHGNGETADYWVDQFGPVQSWGWGVLLLEYPGYGSAPGKPSEASIRLAALNLYDWAASDGRIDSTRIVAYGRSLGGGAAAHLAAARPIAGLILESAFTSLRPLAGKYFVPGWLVRDPFDNLRALRDYRGPLLVLHGSGDRLVPVREGRALAASVPGSEFHVLPCGHNDCPRPWGVMQPFLARISRSQRVAKGRVGDH